MDNAEFLSVVSEAYLVGLDDPRGNAKLRILHGAIAHDLAHRSGHAVEALGRDPETEATIEGAYYPKKVDIVVLPNPQMPLVPAGIGVKLVMNGYQQNKNNYFESMLGETANLRSSGFRYAELFIVPSISPRFREATVLGQRADVIQRMEVFTSHDLDKYSALSQLNPREQLHAPNLVLLCIIELPENPMAHVGSSREAYVSHFRQRYDAGDFDVTFKDLEGGAVEPGHWLIQNDYDEFADRFLGLLTP